MIKTVRDFLIIFSEKINYTTIWSEKNLKKEKKPMLIKTSIDTFYFHILESKSHSKITIKLSHQKNVLPKIIFW